MSAGLERAIILDEAGSAIDSLPLLKAPSPDGLSSEFYKRYIRHIVPLLWRVFVQSYTMNSLSPSFRKRHIGLIAKSVDICKLHSICGCRPIT